MKSHVQPKKIFCTNMGDSPLIREKFYSLFAGMSERQFKYIAEKELRKNADLTYSGNDFLDVMKIANCSVNDAFNNHWKL